MFDVLWLIISYIYIFFILHTSSKLKEYGDEVSRKFAHIAISNIWFIMNHFFSNVYVALLIPSVMIIVMAYSEKNNVFVGLKRDKAKISYGTICYFISMLILSIIGILIYNSLIPMGGFFLLLGYGDALAALCGKKYHLGVYNVSQYTKSISGNIAMLITSYIVFFIYAEIYNLEYSSFQIVFISITATIIEAVSIKGTDNLTIPLVTYIVYKFFYI